MPIVSESRPKKINSFIGLNQHSNHIQYQRNLKYQQNHHQNIKKNNKKSLTSFLEQKKSKNILLNQINPLNNNNNKSKLPSIFQNYQNQQEQLLDSYNEKRNNGNLNINGNKNLNINMKRNILLRKGQIGSNIEKGNNHKSIIMNDNSQFVNKYMNINNQNTIKNNVQYLTNSRINLKQQSPVKSIITGQNKKYSKSPNRNPIQILLRSSPSKNLKQRVKKSQSQYQKLQKIQQNIIMQLKNIDVHLQSYRQNSQQKHKQKQRLKMYNGYIFQTIINQFLIEKFHECIKIQSQNSKAIVQGFDIQKFIINEQGETNIIEAKIIKPVNSVHNRLVDRSIDSIKDYERVKGNQIERNFISKKQWSLFKRTRTQSDNSNVEGVTQRRQNGHYNSIESQLMERNNTGQYSKVSELKKSFAKRNDPQSRSTQLFESKITCLTKLSKNSFLNAQSFLEMSPKYKNKQSPEFKSKDSKYGSVRTQPTQRMAHLSMVVNLTKKDVKNMLNRQKNMVSIWLPPATYPQFFGLFCYKIIKVESKNIQKQYFPKCQTIYRCKLTKYFFYKFSLNLLDKKIFNSILDFICKQSQYLIQQLEITLDKAVYNKIFSQLGWTLKYWEAHNKVKAIYKKSQVDQKSSK